MCKPCPPAKLSLGGLFGSDFMLTEGGGEACGGGVEEDMLTCGRPGCDIPNCDIELVFHCKEIIIHHYSNSNEFIYLLAMLLYTISSKYKNGNTHLL